MSLKVATGALPEWRYRICSAASNVDQRGIRADFITLSGIGPAGVGLASAVQFCRNNSFCAALSGDHRVEVLNLFTTLRGDGVNGVGLVDAQSLFGVNNFSSSCLNVGFMDRFWARRHLVNGDCSRLC